jgi:hypothetical protein
MPCKPFQIWNGFPAGSKLCAKVTTTGDDVIVRVIILDGEGGGTTFGTSALLNGPVCFPLDPRGYGVTATVITGDEAPTVILAIYVEGPDGQKFRECASPFSTAASTATINFTLVPAAGAPQ